MKKWSAPGCSTGEPFGGQWIPVSLFKKSDQFGGPWILASFFKNLDQFGGPWIPASLFKNSDQNGGPWISFSKFGSKWFGLEFEQVLGLVWVKIQDLIQDFYSERGLGLGLGFLPKTWPKTCWNPRPDPRQNEIFFLIRSWVRSWILAGLGSSLG